MTRYMIAIKKAVEGDDGEWRTAISSVAFAYLEDDENRRSELHEELDRAIEKMEKLEGGNKKND